MEIQTFNYNNKNIQGLILDNEAWLLSKEITDELGYKNGYDAILKHVDNEDKKVLGYKDNHLSLSELWHGRDYSKKVLINESGFYSLAFGSKLDSAKRFKHWVTSEVLPSIRKNGYYMTDQVAQNMVDNPREQLADMLITAGEQLKQKDIQIAELTPLAEFGGAMLTSNTNIIVREFAKHAVDNGVKNAGQDRIYKWLRDNGWVIKQDGTDYNLPTQKSMEAGLMDIKVSVGTNGQEFRTTVITPKGQQYFMNLWLQNGFQFEATGIVLKNVKRKRRLSDKQLQDTFDLLKRGYSQGEVARALDISQPTVWKRIQVYRQEFGY